MDAVLTRESRDHDVPPVRTEPDDDRPNDDCDYSHEPEQGPQSRGASMERHDEQSCPPRTARCLLGRVLPGVPAAGIEAAIPENLMTVGSRSPYPSFNRSLTPPDPTAFRWIQAPNRSRAQGPISTAGEDAPSDPGVARGV